MDHVRTKTSAMLADMADSMAPLGPALDGVARSARDAGLATGRLAAIIGPGRARQVVAAVDLGPRLADDTRDLIDRRVQSLVIAGYTNRRAKRQRCKMRRRARFAAQETAA